jgi:hypothetical protein
VEGWRNGILPSYLALATVTEPTPKFLNRTGRSQPSKLLARHPYMESAPTTNRASSLARQASSIAASSDEQRSHPPRRRSHLQCRPRIRELSDRCCSAHKGYNSASLLPWRGLVGWLERRLLLVESQRRTVSGMLRVGCSPHGWLKGVGHA